MSVACGRHVARMDITESLAHTHTHKKSSREVGKVRCGLLAARFNCSPGSRGGFRWYRFKYFVPRGV